jgi:hypothetical protein
MNTQWFDRETLIHIRPKLVKESNVVLDIGCGIRPQEFFKPHLDILCEPNPEYVRVLRQNVPESPDVLILQATAQRAVKLFPDKSIDSVFILDLIEHLEKEDRKCLILEREPIARQQIIIFSPLGFLPQEY